MSIRRSFIAAAGAVALVACTLTGCSTGSSEGAAGAGGAGGAAKGGVTELKVAASVTPHAKILKFINDNLAAKAGLKLDIIKFNDYIQPNETLQSGEVDCNFYQSVPYLHDQTKKHGYKFDSGKGILLLPLGLYSNKIKDVKNLKDGAKIGIINDPTNQVRGLQLLAYNKLLNLPASGPLPSLAKIQSSAQLNPHHFVFQQVEGPQLIRALSDVDVAVINGNFASLGGKSPRDAIALEQLDGNPNVNILVWPHDTKKLAAIKKLDQLLHSQQVKDWIVKTWPDKSVLPAK